MKKAEITAWLDERIGRVNPSDINIHLGDNHFQIGPLRVNVCGDEDTPVIYAGTNGVSRPHSDLPQFSMLEDFGQLQVLVGRLLDER